VVDVVKPPCSVAKTLATTTTISLSNFSNQHEMSCAFMGMGWFYVWEENEEHTF